MQGMLEDNTYHDHTLREIHHRIKNHFYIITGYIQMKRMIGVESVDCLFRDIENRIRAVGLIHEKIYTAQNLVPDTRSYITELSKLVIADMAGVSVDLQVDAEDIPLGKRLLSLGAVVVELITNSMKYGFAETGEPHISITLKHDGGSVLFQYADNGNGFDVELSEGLGMSMLQNFAGNVRGSLTVTGTDGFSADIVIPCED